MNLNLTADVAYRSSGTPYTATSDYDGTVCFQAIRVRDAATMTIVDGAHQTSIPTPELSGLVQDMTNPLGPA